MSTTAGFRWPSVARSAVLRGGPFDAQVREVVHLTWPREIRIPEWDAEHPSRVAAIHVYVRSDELGPTAREYAHARRDAL